MQCFTDADKEVQVIRLRKTVKHLMLIFFIGWNIHTVQATIGPDVYNGINTLTTEIVACFGDMVAKCLFCFIATRFRVQVFFIFLMWKKEGRRKNSHISWLVACSDLQ